jgi:hypothetical protein
MAGGGRWQVCLGARGKEEGGFIGQECRKTASPERRGLQELQHGRGVVATCGGAGGQ